MRTTIDKAGRLVIPKALRDHLGIQAGEVELTADGAALRVEPVSNSDLEEENGALFIPASGLRISDEDVRVLRDADRK